MKSSKELERRRPDTSANDPQQDDNSSTSSTACCYLLVYKVAYFAIYAAFGSMIPYLPLYFKQLGLNAAQTGVLVAIRPFMQAVGAPAAGYLADRFKKRKLIMVIAALGFAAKYLFIMAVQPQHQGCVKTRMNQTENRLQQMSLAVREMNEKRMWDSIASSSWRNDGMNSQRDNNGIVKTQKDLTTFFPRKTVYQNENLERREVTTNNSINSSANGTVILTWTVDNSELIKIFIIVLIIVIVGELIACLLEPLCDASILSCLKDKRDYYGRFRLWGSLGVATATLIIGVVINQNTFHLCGVLKKNYLIAFYFALGFQCVAIIAVMFTRHEYQETSQEKKTERRWSGLFLGFDRLPFWLVIVCMGIMDRFQMDYAAWYLDDLGASSFMIGLATSMHFIVNACTYLVSNYFIRYLGYMNLISLSLVLMAALFVLFSFAASAWVAIVLYSLVGSIICLAWTSAVAYVGLISAPDLLSTGQGFLNGIYTGIGMASGTVIGGLIIKYISVRAAFRVYAGLGLVVLVLFNLTLWVGRTRAEKSQQAYTPLLDREMDNRDD